MAAGVRAGRPRLCPGGAGAQRDGAARLCLPPEAGTGPPVNPFPLDRPGGGAARRAPQPDGPAPEPGSGRYRPKLVSRVPRAVSDEEFNAIFARLPSNRDRALVAFYVSTGARAAELLSATAGGVDPGRQLITVVRKGTAGAGPAARLHRCVRVAAALPGRDGGADPGRAAAAAVVDAALPVRPLAYHAAHRMFERAAERAGSTATLHALRHTAAYRMAEDPSLPLTDIILSFCVSQGCDLRRPVVDSVADGTLAA